MSNISLINAFTIADEKIAKSPKVYEEMVNKHLKKLIEQEDNFKDNIKKIGASEIGDDCMRKLWYRFNKVHTSSTVDARLIRLFNRGKLEEARILAYLELGELEVWDTDPYGKQFFFSEFDGAFQGHCDGLIRLNNEIFLLEMKTTNDKQFNALKKEGVKRHYPIYYTQCNVYMGYFKLQGAYFIAVNKNDDNIYCEYIPYDKNEFEYALDKAVTIVNDETGEYCSKLSDFPSYFKCRFCEYHSLCFPPVDSSLFANLEKKY